jgi:hypothetical protein
MSWVQVAEAVSRRRVRRLVRRSLGEVGSLGEGGSFSEGGSANPTCAPESSLRLPVPTRPGLPAALLAHSAADCL